jgi:hypothetical protein
MTHELSRGAWTLEPAPAPPSARRWSIAQHGAACTRAAWLAALGSDEDARAALTAVVRAAPFAALLWETPALAPVDDARAAELMVIDSPALAQRAPDPSAFSAVFAATREAVATFANLDGSSTLIAPHPARAPGAAHLAAFVRAAPAEVVDALWIAVARAVAAWRAARARTLWVSTSGLAVPWLHVRLDGAPKYYAHAPYRAP